LTGAGALVRNCGFWKHGVLNNNNLCQPRIPHERSRNEARAHRWCRTGRETRVSRVRRWAALRPQHRQPTGPLLTADGSFAAADSAGSRDSSGLKRLNYRPSVALLEGEGLSGLLGSVGNSAFHRPCIPDARIRDEVRARGSAGFAERLTRFGRGVCEHVIADRRSGRLLAGRRTHTPGRS
jgi:hypothetical protein